MLNYKKVPEMQIWRYEAHIGVVNWPIRQNVNMWPQFLQQHHSPLIVDREEPPTVTTECIFK